jgi:hypothetical protein
VDDKVWDPAGTVTAAPKEVILNVQTGRTTDVPGVGAGDEVWFNKGDGNYYVTGSGSPLRPTPAAAAQGASVLGGRQCRQQPRLRGLGGQQRLPRLLDRVYRGVLSAAEGGITDGPLSASPGAHRCVRRRGRDRLQRQARLTGFVVSPLAAARR